MKSKLAALLIVIGGVIAGFTCRHADFTLIPFIIIGGLALGLSFLFFNSVYGGKVWGIKIKASSRGALVSFLSVIGLVLGGFGIVCTIIAMIHSLASGEFIGILVNIICLLVPLAVGPFIGKKITENFIVAKSDNALCLGNIELFKEIDTNISNASHFVVGFEGVALFSSTNYCFAVYRYEDYQLGELSTPEEVALVGTYFVQKYHEQFTFKVDVEVIPGEPGQTVVAVGTGGIAVGRTSGTPDQRIFRSYIFTKR